jgi:hypothetical protein
MSTRFYAGPISIGMGRRWDDKFEPDTGKPPPRGSRTPRRSASPSGAPLPASTADARPAQIDPIAPRR